MHAMQIHAKIIALVIFFIQPAAVYCAGNVDELIFILSRGSEPAKVTNQLPKKGSDQFMRLPDRSMSGHSVEDSHARGSHKSMTKPPQDPHKENDFHEGVSEQTTSLNFKATNITGTVKLPRVKFTNLRPAIDLREEMPSLDFTGKSLKDSGF